MNALVQGKFFKLSFRKTEKMSYHELRITQRNDKGINTEVFPVFDEDMVNLLDSFLEDEDIALDCEVYVKNGYLQKQINRIVDVKTGEVI